MSRRSRGMTLVELLVSIVIMSFVTLAASTLFSVCLKAHAHGTSKSALQREGLFAMERMCSGLRSATHLFIPNGHSTSRALLAFSAPGNEDNDFYFGDPLFPRVNEDPRDDVEDDGKPGIKDVDDDGDGLVDEGAKEDDDEDGLGNEDRWNGIDDDLDGNVDEDTDKDVNFDAKSGISGMDDDGDGSVDEGQIEDDDEDDLKDEDGPNPLVFSLDVGTGMLRELDTLSGTTRNLATHATAFLATYEPPGATHAPRILITLTLTGDGGESVTFSEYAYPRNILQRTGKRVR